ncbi:protein spaetzle 5 [Drosophila pseudoobscura]|uniref:Protein spaetzle 5 n=1 Tax=Drosophila pseudoobscura pseudoobscura TaxID=46245 RepID=A0A6I8VM17_DROPS|nr:protein spaetzle 5 [Drosophila pseudoobscura]XP_015043778.2 protein spaetzle 5 [Drosophila pseudoobscura]
MTKSIKCLRTSSCNRILLAYVILACTAAAHSSPPPCGLYGAPPCQFLPAPPGQTPSCARPGKTYCEHADNYPTYLIKSLVRKWGYEAGTLLVDETWEDFAAVAWHETPVFYDPKSIFPSRDPNGQDFNGYSYQTPFGGSSSQRVNGGNSLFASSPSTEAPTYLLYTSSGGGHRAGQRYNHHQGAAGGSAGQLFFNQAGKTTPYNATLWLKRLVRDLSRKQKEEVPPEEEKQPEKEEELLEKEEEQQPKEGEEQQQQEEEEHQQIKRDVSLNMDLLDIVGVAGNPSKKRTRTKRQSPGRSTLCQTTSQFITPQAALNSRGNWMFVVNEQNTARQMVKAELCASNTCSNLCELPNGYNSRCEQKFVQKRLIALQGNGQNLYTDTFWFPSCCVCTIAAN